LHVLVGVTWSVWHLPLYGCFMARTDFRVLASLQWPLFLPLFFAGVIAAVVLLGELRLRTGSIRPGVVMRTVGGAVVNAPIVDTYLRTRRHGDAATRSSPRPRTRSPTSCSSASSASCW
jgi:hypothetical protein